MRRIVLPFAVAVASVLAACAGGGSVFGTNGNSADNVIITLANQSGTTDPGLFAVRQGAGLQLHAQAVKNSTNGVTNPSGFIWTVQITTTGTVSINQLAQPIACTPITTVPSPQPSPTVAPSPFAFTLPQSSIAVAPEDSSYATFTPPLLPSAGTGRAFANQQFCAIVTAQGGGATGSQTILVSP